MSPTSDSHSGVHRQAIVGLVSRMVGEASLADEIAQETYLRALRTNARHRGEASERTWLCAIAVNLVRDHFRARSRARIETPHNEKIEDVPSNADDGERTVLKNEMSACIGRFLAELPSPRYEVVTLHDQSELSHNEIAQHLGISEANSRVLLHRGRADLRKILGRNCVLSFGGDAIPCELKPVR